jgi:hypothetical protein
MLEILKGTCHSKDLGVDGIKILKLVLRKYFGKMWTDSSGSGYGPVVGASEHTNEPSASIKDREFLD